MRHPKLSLPSGVMAQVLLCPAASGEAPWPQRGTHCSVETQLGPVRAAVGWHSSPLSSCCDPQSCPGLAEVQAVCGGLYFIQSVPPFRLFSPLQIEHCHAECVTDTQVCGARFCDPEGNSFAVTGYDLSEIYCYGRA